MIWIITLLSVGLNVYLLLNQATLQGIIAELHVRLNTRIKEILVLKSKIENLDRRLQYRKKRF